MHTKNHIFHATCLISTFAFIVFAFFPLATLAFHTTGPPEPNLPFTPAKSVEENPYPPPSKCVLEAELTTSPVPGLPFYDAITFPERQQAGLPTELPAVKPYYAEKTVYLTFDDGPDPDNTPAILRILHANGVKATFFVIGTEMEKYPHILKQIFREGHAIGNHTYNHVYRDLYHSADTYTGQLNRTDDIIKYLAGVRPRISRAPGGSAGSFTKEYWEALKTQGYVEVGWNINSGDASRAKAGALVSNITRQINTNSYLCDHAIVLMHDGRGHEETVKALPEIIKFFKERGFHFRVVNLETPPAW